MAKIFEMPKLGMDMEEGTVNKWLKKEGETVEKGEALVDIESDKASVTVESNKSGKLLKIYLAEGEDCPCGTPIAYIGNEGDKFPETLTKKAEEKKPEEKSPVAAPVSSQAPAQTAAAPACAPAEIVRPGGKLRATPRARRFAEKNGIDINLVAGTGPAGRIVEEDVKNALANGVGSGFGVRRAARIKQETVEPFTGIRKFIGNRMKQSLSESAQTNTRMDIDMSNVVSFRQQLNAKFEEQGIKISYLDIIVAACAKALVLHKEANCALMEDGIHYKNYANVGVAVDSAKGLVVPVIKDADVLSLVEIHNKSAELVKKAREGTLTPDDMSGGTFTVSNLGMFEVDSFTAIVNPPETCILAVSRIKDSVVALNGQPAVRPVMNICLSYDHRVIDGAPSAKFLREVKHYLENPVWLLADNM